MEAAETKENILILGGGDGVAAKEVLKYSEVDQVTLVDLDPAVTELAASNPHLIQLNENALEDERVQVRNEDAFKFLEEADSIFDVIIVDLPDPNNESLNKLYTREFYSLVRNHLAPEGASMIQATSPLFAREVYWTIDETIRDTGLNVENFHVDIPSFGNWGFIMASKRDISVEDLNITQDTEFLTNELLQSMTVFGKDEDREIVNRDGESVSLEPNTLIHPNLIQKYEQAWQDY